MKIEEITKLRKQGKTLAEISKILKRTPQAISYQLRKKFGSSGSVTIKKEYKCLECKKVFYKTPSHILNPKRAFCSRECGKKWHSIRCQRCKQISFSQKKYRMCNKCNTTRLKEWRNRPGKMKIVYNINKKSQDKYPEKVYARWFLRIKLKQGLVFKPNHCAECNNTNIHAHHPDYSKPLEVLWLCPLHHKQIHKLSK